MNARPSAALQIRVALFVLVTLSVLIAAVLVLGKSTNLFARKATLHSSFENVGGLIAGSEVRLAGMTIGVVHNIHFSPDPANRRVGVDFSIHARYLERIREDSVAQVTSKGLLGDAIIDISVGSPDKPALKDGDTIESEEPAGLGQIVGKAETAIQHIDGLATDVDVRVRQLLTPEVAADFAALIHTTAAVAQGVEQGPGLVHALLYDPKLTGDTTRAVAEIERTASALEKSAGDIEKLAGELERSGGSLEQVLTEVRTGHGVLHQVIYDEEKQHLVRDLGETARLIRQLVAETEQGKGTVGALLKDPTAYNDLLTILGNVKRNVLLKALIRLTIAKDGLARPGRIDGADPKAQGESTGTGRNNADSATP